MTCKPPTCAGDLRVPFTLERATWADDGAGGQIPTWATVETGFCSLAQDQSGAGENPDRDRLTVFTSLVMWMHYGHTITEKDRVVLEGKTWNVRKVDDWQFRKVWLRVDLESGIPVTG
jgi:head-tail adaptor